MDENKQGLSGIVADTLRFANAARVALGMGELPEIPKGVKYDAFWCPLGVHLDQQVQFNLAYISVHLTEKSKLDAIQKAWKETDPDFEWTVARGLFSTADRWILRYPRALERFIKAFDNGWLPELLKPIQKED